MKVDFHHYCSLAQLAIQQLMEKVVAPILDLERVGALSEKKDRNWQKEKFAMFVLHFGVPPQVKGGGW